MLTLSAKTEWNELVWIIHVLQILLHVSLLLLLRHIIYAWLGLNYLSGIIILLIQCIVDYGIFEDSKCVFRIAPSLMLMRWVTALNLFQIILMILNI